MHFSSTWIKINKTFGHKKVSVCLIGRLQTHKNFFRQNVLLVFINIYENCIFYYFKIVLTKISRFCQQKKGVLFSTAFKYPRYKKVFKESALRLILS